MLEVGGFLGIGEHRVAIPVEQFQQIYPRVVLPGANKESLKKLTPDHAGRRQRDHRPRAPGLLPM